MDDVRKQSLREPKGAGLVKQDTSAAESRRRGSFCACAVPVSPASSTCAGFRCLLKSGGCIEGRGRIAPGFS